MSMAKGEVMLGKVDHGVPLEYSTEEGVLKIFGFWVFLASDLILFATLFALYSILYTHTNGGPGPADLYEVRGFTAETFILLTSSFTCGLATHQMRLGDAKWMNIWLVVTLLLGLSFIALEVSEFITYVARGATIQKSAFLSSFFCSGRYARLPRLTRDRLDALYYDSGGAPGHYRGDGTQSIYRRLVLALP